MLRSLIIVVVFLSSCAALAFETKVVFKNNLSFEAPSLDSLVRQNETFSSIQTDPELEETLTSTVEKTIKLLPAQYLPPRLTINVEQNALFKKTGKSAEQIPLSMVMTTQIPTRNEIRYSDFEIRNHPDAIRTIIAHETGHMLIEWACRSNGVTKPTDSTVLDSHWVGSIYEGVADFISAIVNNSTVIGTPNAWYSRDILKFKTLTEAHQSSVSTVQLIEGGFTQEGLIPRYQTYVDLMADFKKEGPSTTVGDAYVEAPWVAGQLWLLSEKHGSQVVFDTVLKIAMSGKKFTDPELFLKDVSSNLENPN